MWSLETLAQINQKHAELGRDGPVDHREVYAECGIRLLGDTQRLPVVPTLTASEASRISPERRNVLLPPGGPRTTLHGK